MAEPTPPPQVGPPGPPVDRAVRHRRLRRYLAVVGVCAVALSLLSPMRGAWAPAATVAMIALSTGMIVFSLLALRTTIRMTGPGQADGLPPLGPAAQHTLDQVYSAHARARAHLWTGLAGGAVAALMWPLGLLVPAPVGPAATRLVMVIGAGVMAINGWRCIRAYRQMGRPGGQHLDG
jgi:hypothetical protein